MLLTVPSHYTCNDPAQPTICYVATGTTFTVSVDLLNPPAVGYYHAQAWINYDNQGLVHKPIPQATWPDCHQGTFLTINDPANNGAQAGCLTDIVAPLASHYAGSMYTFELTCSESPTKSVINLIPAGQAPAGTSGSEIHDIDGGHPLAKLGDLTIECVDAGPGDTDGDGCSDEQEFGPDETLGGRRNYLNPWDYFDTNGDQFIDLPNDILGVIQHFAPTGAPPYDVAFDRGHRDGDTLWSMTAPDGVIDLPIDILGVIYQFGHNCG